jgi:peptidoglycan/LPS O-acetylase OafA/YrhL
MLHQDKHSYVPGIDGLRAVSVLSVMIYHLKASFLRGGFVGVDVFFVISGFVVTLSIYGRHFRSIGELLAYFYARRLVRIAPALIVMLVITSVATIAVVPAQWLSDANMITAFYAFFGLSNVRLYQLAEDYFGPRTDFNPFAHTWSLGVEEQFYLLFPLLVGAAVLARMKRGQYLSLYITLALSAVSFLLCAILSSRAPVFSFYQIPTRFWELGLGTALALSSQSWSKALKTLDSSTLNVVYVVAIIALALSFAYCDETRFPFPWAVPPVLASGAILCVLFLQRPTLVTKLLSNKLISFVGLISYSLYLWHWPIYVLFRWTTGLSTWFFQLLAVFITVAVSTASYFAVELPLRRSRVLASFPRAAVVAGFLFVIVPAAGVSRAAFHFSPEISLSVTNSSMWKSFPKPRIGCVRYPNDPFLPNQTFLPHCAPTNNGQIVVAGDSHAGAYSKMLERISVEQRLPVTIYSEPGCPFLNFRIPIRLLTPACSDFNRTTQALIIRDAGPSTYVFLPSLRVDRYRDQWGGENRHMDGPVDNEAVQEAISLLKVLSRQRARIILEAPTPMFEAPPFRCSDWFNHMNPICSPGFTVDRSEFDLRRSAILEAESKIADSVSGVTIWDPVPILCNEKKCDAFDHGNPLFVDGDHLSAHGNDVLFESFARHLRSALPPSSSSSQ